MINQAITKGTVGFGLSIAPARGQASLLVQLLCKLKLQLGGHSAAASYSSGSSGTGSGMSENAEESANPSGTGVIAGMQPQDPDHDRVDPNRCACCTGRT